MPKKVQTSNLLSWTHAYCAYNALVACAVLYKYTQDPKAAALEYLPDVAIHALEALAPQNLNKVALAANFARGLQAGYAFFSGNSTIPDDANVADIFNHGMNVYCRLSAG